MAMAGTSFRLIAAKKSSSTLISVLMLFNGMGGAGSIAGAGMARSSDDKGWDYVGHADEIRSPALNSIV